MDLDNFENQGNKGRQYTMTIKEIAQMAGVSSAAVSRYLNGGYVSEQKKEQIRKVIEKTGYQPSTQARILRTCSIPAVIRLIDSELIFGATTPTRCARPVLRILA